MPHPCAKPVKRRCLTLSVLQILNRLKYLALMGRDDFVVLERPSTGAI